MSARRTVGVALAAGILATFAAVPAPSAEAADRISDGQWFHAFLNTAAAHRVSTGAGVTVAVVDTGVEGAHPDLAGSVLPGADFSEEGPGDGQVDRKGHGTLMAGLIAANGRVKGIAPAAKVLAVRSSVDYGDPASAAQAVTWATEQKADVISISWGSDVDDRMLRQAVEAALAADIVVVAAVGNLNETGEVGYPASIKGVLGVASVDQEGNRSKTSVSGYAVALAAPGEKVSSTYLDAGWTTASGTSIATALVAGTAALIRSRFPEMSAAEVAHRITATATDKGHPGPDGEYGSGVLNVLEALTAQVPSLTPSARPTASASEEPSNGWNPWLPGVVPVTCVTVLLGVGFVGMRLLRRRRPSSGSSQG